MGNGVLLYPKPAGMTSHDVVATVRRRIVEEMGVRERVGHAGTLDPFATGLLLVLVGRATRVQQFLMALLPVKTASWATARPTVNPLDAANTGAGLIMAAGTALEERWVFARNGIHVLAALIPDPGFAFPATGFAAAWVVAPLLTDG